MQSEKMARMKIITISEVTDSDTTDRIVSANSVAFDRIPKLTILRKDVVEPYIWEAARAIAEIAVTEEKVVDVPSSRWRRDEARDARRRAQVAVYWALSSGALDRWEAKTKGKNGHGKRLQMQKQTLEESDSSGWWLVYGRKQLIPKTRDILPTIKEEEEELLSQV
jgi:hypothetical protein